MSANGLNGGDDFEMGEYDGEKVVTMMDVLQEQQEFEDDANAVLGASDEKNCTYSKGYIKRQAIYACLTCCSEAKIEPEKRAGVCLACSLNCHENHELIELYTKRNFRCDCGNPKCNHPCQFSTERRDLNVENSYNQNFSGVYCVCSRPYPDPEATFEEEMIQCIVCEDWLHTNHLEATVPGIEHYSEMICKKCMDLNEFLHDYSELVVNIQDREIEVVSCTSLSIPNGHDAEINGLLNGEISNDIDNTDTSSENKMDVDNESIGTKVDASSDIKASDNNIEDSEDQISKNDVLKQNDDIIEDRQSNVTNNKELDTKTEKDITKEPNKTIEENEIENTTEESKMPEYTEPSDSENKEAPVSSNLTSNTDGVTEQTEFCDKNIEIKRIDEVSSKEPVSPGPSSTQPNDAIEQTEVPLNDQNKNNDEATVDNTKMHIESEVQREMQENPPENNEVDSTVTDNIIPSNVSESQQPTTEQNNIKDKEVDTLERATEELKELTSDDNTRGNNFKIDSNSQVLPNNDSYSEEKAAEMEKSENSMNQITNSTIENKDTATELQESTVRLEMKRKLEEPIENTSKKAKLNYCTRPKSKKLYKGSTFWPANFRQKLCTCSECLAMYKDLSVMFLIDPEDTVTAYETLGQEKSDGTSASQYEKGMEALSSLDRVQQINALTEYNKMRDKLLDFLQSFKDRQEIVKEEDIRAFFAGMKPKREPDGVYFCR